MTVNEKNNIFNQVEYETVVSRMKEVTDKIRRQKLVLLTFWFIVTFFLTIIYYMVLSFHETPLRNLIYALLFAVTTVNWFINIPFVGIMLIIVFRTKSRNYFYQVFPTMGLLILVTVIAFSSTVQFSEDSVELIIYIGILLVLIVLESTMLGLYVQGIKTNKKPLWFYSFFQDTLESYSSTILSQQALHITDLQDGYSQRPFFASFQEISEHCSSMEEYLDKTREYAQFLVRKSELIGWDINDEDIVLYPRVLLGHADFGIGIKYLWELLVRLYRKKGLTSITIDFRLEEITLSIAREDYEWLGNVTYHLLGQQILNRFKQSIIAFLKDDLDKSYSSLFFSNDFAADKNDPK
ncbi:MAG: hypothetical protein ACXACU_01215 [Candidatus Hodarchaeales archaeon]|jgi:hypothetical protein